MKTLKKFKFYFLMCFAMMAALSSCQKEDILENQQIEVVEESADVQNNDAASKKPYFPSQNNPICYNAGLEVDKDCDGSYGLGWNEVTTSISACWTRVYQMAYEANGNGWCYNIPQGTDNCQTFTCEFN